MKKITAILGIIAGALTCGAVAHADEHADRNRLERVVDDAIRPLMESNNVPGMAVAVTVDGKRYFFNYGVASKEGRQKVSENTIFEIGSVSKTFTATLGAYAQVRGALSLSDPASKYLPALAGSRFDTITLLELGTYTAGGLPLQFPDSVSGQDGMIAYFKGWRPSYPAGTQRVYSNPSIGLFGYLAARSMGEPFDDLMEKTLFPAFGLTRTYIRVPRERMGDYAYGYSKDDKPVRVTPGIRGSEAYGVKTTTADMVRYVEANMDPAKLAPALQRAIAGTQTGYFQVGNMTQGLGWEMYAYPTSLDVLLGGNSARMSFEPNAATRLTPPQPPRSSVLVNKTGSTNGFGAYVVFVPAKRMGIVMLANKNYPNAARVKAAHQILTALESQPSSANAR
jgi:beta-lactamase class C